VKLERAFAILLILAGFLGLCFLRDSTPFLRLLASSLGMIWIIKLAALLWQRSAGLRFRSHLGAVIFLFDWPGVSVAGFNDREAIPKATGARFLESWLSLVLGLAILICSSLAGRGESNLLNYVSLLSILMIVHLGLVEVVADGIRLLGFSPASLFDRPYLAASLRDFWSLRWNRAFVDMNKIFILGPLRKKVSPAILTFSIFAVSGVLHEIGISYSDGVSWGSPLLYFLIQGIGMQVEKHWRFPRALVWAWVFLPLPLLFTPAFTNLFLGGSGRLISDFALSLSREQVFHDGLILGGASHLLVLCASVQVPGKLGWREDFQKLSSLNRKVFWTYGGYVLSIIVFMSATSFLLSGQDFQRLSLPTFLWVLFIALFWWARVLTDLLYMKHSDWPQGPLFSIGHICLATLFISMSVLYSILAAIAYTAMN
jgi:hypothetical protein